LILHTLTDASGVMSVVLPSYAPLGVDVVQARLYGHPRMCSLPSSFLVDIIVAKKL